MRAVYLPLAACWRVTYGAGLLTPVLGVAHWRTRRELEVTLSRANLRLNPDNTISARVAA